MSRPKRRSAARPRARLLQVEILEDRLALSSLVVNTAATPSIPLKQDAPSASRPSTVSTSQDSAGYSSSEYDSSGDSTSLSKNEMPEAYKSGERYASSIPVTPALALLPGDAAVITGAARGEARQPAPAATSAVQQQYQQAVTATGVMGIQEGEHGRSPRPLPPKQEGSSPLPQLEAPATSAAPAETVHTIVPELSGLSALALDETMQFPPQLQSLLGSQVPFDVAALQRDAETFFAHVENLGRELLGSPLLTKLAPWILNVAAAAATLALARRTRVQFEWNVSLRGSTATYRPRVWLPETDTYPG